MAAFLKEQKIHGFFKSPNSRLVVNVASLSTPIIALLPSHCRPEIHFIARRLTLPCPESLLHYLASCHVFVSHLFSTSASCAPAIVILISGPRLHHPRHRLGIFRLSHLRTPLCLCTRSVVLISRLFYPATRIPRRRVLVFGHRYRYLRYPCIVLVRHPHRILSTSLLSSYRLYGLAHNLAGARPKKGGYCHRRVCLKPESSDGNLVQPLNVALYVK